MQDNTLKRLQAMGIAVGWAATLVVAAGSLARGDAERDAADQGAVEKLADHEGRIRSLESYVVSIKVLEAKIDSIAQKLVGMSDSLQSGLSDMARMQRDVDDRQWDRLNQISDSISAAATEDRP